MTFNPLGDQARWKTVYEILQKTEVNDVLTYEEMGEALGLHPASDRHLIQAAVHRAAKELLEVERHALMAITNVGYRVVTAEEHLLLARGHQRKSHKQLALAQDKVEYVDLSEVDPITRRAFGLVAEALSAQADFNRRMDIRQRNLASKVAEIQQDHSRTKQRTEDEIQILRARLRRLEEEVLAEESEEAAGQG